MSSVLDHPEAVLFRDLDNGSHVGSQTTEMNRQYDFRSRSNRPLDPGGINVQRILLDVYEYRMGAQVSNHLRAGGKRVRSGDYFVTGADANCLEGEVETSGRGVHCDPLCAAPDKCGEFLLELFCLGPGRDPA